jgi:hypothetical protein
VRSDIGADYRASGIARKRVALAKAHGAGNRQKEDGRREGLLATAAYQMTA